MREEFREGVREEVREGGQGGKFGREVRERSQ